MLEVDARVVLKQPVRDASTDRVELDALHDAAAVRQRDPVLDVSRNLVRGPAAASESATVLGRRNRRRTSISPPSATPRMTSFCRP
jgi:hypothetical protein